MTIQENVYYDGENDEYQEWDTCIFYNCLLCKKSKVEMLPAKLLDKEKVDLIESYEDN